MCVLNEPVSVYVTSCIKLIIKLIEINCYYLYLIIACKYIYLIKISIFFF